MGRGTLKVLPEMLAPMMMSLPSTALIVGSKASDGYVTLVVESEFIVGERAELIGVMEVDGLCRKFRLNQVDG